MSMRNPERDEAERLIGQPPKSGQQKEAGQDKLDPSDFVFSGHARPPAPIGETRANNRQNAVAQRNNGVVVGQFDPLPTEFT
jgi:hypothetical protein